MDLADELLYAADAGVKMISITAPERQRFYTHLSTFVAEEMARNPEEEYERMIIIRAGEKFGWYDVDSNKIHTTMSSSHVNDDLWDLMTMQAGNAKLGVGEDADDLSEMIERYLECQQTDERGNIFKTCLVIEDADILISPKETYSSYRVRDRRIFSALRSFTDHKHNPNSDKMIILLSESQIDLKHLEKEVLTIRLGYPDTSELSENFQLCKIELGMEESDITGDENKIIEAARGLSLVEAEMTFRTVAAQNGKKFPPGSEYEIMSRKKKIISKSGALEYIESSINKEDVGGLGILMDWLDQRKDLLEEKAKIRNIPSPKGVLFVGVPGSGKSLTAKLVSTIFSRPLVRFDVAACYGSYIGQSEETLRKSLDIAKAVSPCVLWIDEIDKALAGGSGGGGDSGVSARVFGTLLTWMNEKDEDVFLVATANNLSQILETNPELFRKGRFDQIFFVDYPSKEVRKDIFNIHLMKKAVNSTTSVIMKNSIDIELLNLDQLAEKTDKWTGSEIEYAVIGSLIYAHHEGDRILKQEDILRYISENPCDFSKSDGNKYNEMKTEALKLGIKASK
ncbi:AAA family ATPase [Euryarchaeota archaeon]|nr:AAA family ATPase [Euryarchaeota archaeon]